MSRLLLALLLSLVAASSARAHFVFVVPEASGGVAYVILSEHLDPDEDVPLMILNGLELKLRGLDGSEAPLTMLPDEFAFRVEYPQASSRLIYGALQLGVHKAGDKPGNLVSYYPKAILHGDAFAAETRLLESVPVELVPVGAEGDVRFQLLLHGRPVEGAEVTVYLPDGGRTQVNTDADGLTETFTQRGRYGAWARATLGGAGVHEGEEYEEARGYATLVAQVGDADAGRPAVMAGAEPQPAGMTLRPWRALPQATSSFGAVEADGWMYVYGGHIARTHDYDTEAVSGRFSRIDLDNGGVWETLPPGPRLQGLNLAAHNGMVYRVGGMQPRNARGAQRDNYSVADCARFNPDTMQWEWLAPMPEARSSHDLVVVDDTLYVLGGWNMLGEIEGNVWPDYMVTLDLTDPIAQWRREPQPFARRALITAVHEGRIYVMGGMDDADEVSREVDVYDPATGEWSRGPELLGEMDFAGFASAACVLDGRLYASVAGGEVMRLSEDGGAWEMVGTHTPRIVHRLVPWRGEIFVVGGAAKGTNTDLVEVLSPSGMRVSQSQVAPRVRTARREPVPMSEPPRVAASLAPESAPRRSFELLGDVEEALAQLDREVMDPAAREQTEKFIREFFASAENSGERFHGGGQRLFLEIVPGEKAGTDAAASGSAAEADAAAGTQVFCPVMTKVEVLGDDEAIAVEYEGQEVLLCCSKCAKKWEADPAAYVALDVLPQLAGVELPERTIKQKYCPVYPTRVVSESDPFVMYEGKKIYLFNKTAVRRFTEDPQKYLDPAILPQLAE